VNNRGGDEMTKPEGDCNLTVYDLDDNVMWTASVVPQGEVPYGVETHFACRMEWRNNESGEVVQEDDTCRLIKQCIEMGIPIP
jgi:hypothetical protein